MGIHKLNLNKIRKRKKILTQIMKMILMNRATRKKKLIKRRKEDLRN